MNQDELRQIEEWFDTIFMIHIPALLARVRELEAEREKYKRLEEAARKFFVSNHADEGDLEDNLIKALAALEVKS